MAYDRALISSILRQMEHRHDQYEAEAESRRYQLTAAIPRLGEIDRELRSTAAKAMRIAFESNNTAAEIETLKQKNLALQAEKQKLLLQNGYPADYLVVAMDCPACRDTGYHGSKLCDCVKRQAAEIQKKHLSSLLPVERETFETFRLDYFKIGGNYIPLIIQQLIRLILVDQGKRCNTAKDLLRNGILGLGDIQIHHFSDQFAVQICIKICER